MKRLRASIALPHVRLRAVSRAIPDPCRLWCHRIESAIVTNRTVRHFVITACAIGAAWCWLTTTSA